MSCGLDTVVTWKTGRDAQRPRQRQPETKPPSNSKSIAADFSPSVRGKEHEEHPPLKKLLIIYASGKLNNIGGIAQVVGPSGTDSGVIAKNVWRAGQD